MIKRHESHVWLLYSSVNHGKMTLDFKVTPKKRHLSILLLMLLSV